MMGGSGYRYSPLTCAGPSSAGQTIAVTLGDMGMTPHDGRHRTPGRPHDAGRDASHHGRWPCHAGGF